MQSYAHLNIAFVIDLTSLIEVRNYAILLGLEKKHELQRSLVLISSIFDAIYCNVIYYCKFESNGLSLYWKNNIEQYLFKI